MICFKAFNLSVLIDNSIKNAHTDNRAMQRNRYGSGFKECRYQYEGDKEGRYIRLSILYTATLFCSYFVPKVLSIVSISKGRATFAR